MGGRTIGPFMPRSAPPEPDIRTVSFVSLGCPKNLVDSEKMLGLLAQDGVVPVSADAAENGEPVDAAVINTCGFLEASKEESLEAIRQAIERKRAGLVGRVIVAGCLVQRHREKLLEWAPGIDAMVGVFDRDKIVEAVGGRAGRAASALAASDQPRYWISANGLAAARERGLKTTGLTVNGKDSRGIGYFEDDSARLRLTPRHYAYLRVSEGCNQNCTFCTIPSIRGKMRSKPLEAIAAEARELLADGAFELILIGQDTTSYGDDIGIGYDHDGRGGGGLPALLRTLNDVVSEHGRGDGAPGWVRLMYAYPSTFNDAMIDSIASLPRILKYIDMPLQHASDRVLAAMRRNVTSAHQESLIGRLRERMPGMAIRTTLISGFPGETEDDHREVLDFVERSRFDALGVFEYSREDHTPAGRMELDPSRGVPAEVKTRRRDEIMRLQQRLAFERTRNIAEQFDPAASRATGVRVDVLIDRPLATRGRATAGVGPGGRLYQGRTQSQAPDIDGVTMVQSRAALKPGDVVACTVIDADGYDLIARPANELGARREPIARS